MEKYYGVIYFKDGRRMETGTFTGGGAEKLCERHTAQQFDQLTRTITNACFKPTRYEVKVKK